MTTLHPFDAAEAHDEDWTPTARLAMWLRARRDARRARWVMVRARAIVALHRSAP